MPARSQARRKIVATVAALERHSPGDPRIGPLRAELGAAQLEEHIRAVVDTFPPLTADQRNRLAVILLGSPAGDGDAT